SISNSFPDGRPAAGQKDVSVAKQIGCGHLGRQRSKRVFSQPTVAVQICDANKARPVYRVRARDFVCTVLERSSLEMLEPPQRPMPGNFANPLHPRVLHRHVRVEPLRHRLRDERLALLGEQREELFLLLDEGVDVRETRAELCDDTLLLFAWGNWNRKA